MREINYGQLKKDIIQLLIFTRKEESMKTVDLCNILNIDKRTLKAIISELRKIYPICSKDTDGGGYWLDFKKEDINGFIKLLKIRRDSYNKTIKDMESYL